MECMKDKNRSKQRNNLRLKTEKYAYLEEPS